MPDNAANRGPGNGKALLAVIILLIVLFPLLYSVIGGAIPRDAEVPEVFLERPDAKYDTCVQATEYMRWHHWELLREIREEVVRYGNRGELGLNKCKECHTSRERFCDKCHHAVSLTPDCWGCHYYP